MIALTLALVEMGSIFAVACAMVFVESRPLLTSSIGSAAALAQAFALSACCVVAFYLGSLYDLRMVPSFARFASRLPTSLSLALILFAGSYLLLPSSRVAERWFIGGLVGVGLVLPLRAVSYALMASRPFLERVLILGTSPLASQLIQEIQAQPHRRSTIVGVVGNDTAPREPAFRQFPVGHLDKLGEIVDRLQPDRIIVALAERPGRLPVGHLLEAQMRRIVVEDGVEAYERLTGKLAIEALTPRALIFGKDWRPSRFNVLVGRALSLFVAVVGLVGLAPLFGLIALAIKLDSRGPVFFLQERVGQWGRPFTLGKFRTMHPARRSKSEWERDNCDRITRVGWWLRRFRLDELPQLINVLRGDMNLVGPRPHPMTNRELMILAARNLNELTGDAVPYYALRCAVRPGITGWAQIRYGYANDLDEETEKLRYDLYYVKHMSPWFDLGILLETVKFVGLGRQSATVEARPVQGAAAVAVLPTQQRGLIPSNDRASSREPTWITPAS